MSTINDRSDEPVKFLCPSIDELSTIVNEVKCEECKLIFRNEPQFRMHDFKVHKRKNLGKTCKKNFLYHCPIKDCIYAPNKKKHFTLYKYLKQHFLKVHAEKKFTCTRCTKSFSTNAAREAHVRICGTNFTCECLKIFNSYEALLTHAKRNSHKIDQKYRSNKGSSKKKYKQNSSAIICTTFIKNEGIEITNAQKPVVYILPKPTSEAAVQTEEIKIKRKSNSPKNKILKNQVCRQTQTSETVKERQSKKSAETQTAKTVPRVIRVRQVGKRKKISIDKNSIIREDISLVETLSSEYLLPNSPLALRHDIILQDLWEERSTSGTQTSPEKTIFGDIDDYNMQSVTYHGISRSDPMLTEETFTDRFSSIETQTEKAYCRSIFESDPLSSNNETQTTGNFTEAMEPLHIYSNTCTQTCDEILSSDLGLSDIQTQTAWSHLDESTVSTETQTKALKCISGCNDSNSWFATQTNHMETQTDLLHIFEDLA
ncbi:protein indeterminate-domain 16 isoform X2 [Nasonia vitripennis]|nr:protein indeterminate-domain 16 isoform X2 [Nasonia vitripennis]XP_008210595.1 protein indeterminate-domain 16 isoform X2 [Nasonia vitripennis]XP_008210596.1 protein indeterminate-domain 16 isoform X2 [Nasonia vitripennis]